MSFEVFELARRLWDCQNSIKYMKIYKVCFLVKNEANEAYDVKECFKMFNQ